MRLFRIFQTATFRVSALYVAVFAGSVVAVGTGVFLFTHMALERQIENRIASEMAFLKAEFQAGGLNRLIGSVNQREQTHSAGPLNYWFSNAVGDRLAGDLPYVPSDDGWGEVGYRESDGDFGRARVLVARLSDGTRLGVAADLEQIDEVQDTVFSAFASAFAAVLILGILGGLGLSAAVLTKVETITRTAEAIIAGDVSLRVPTGGTKGEFNHLALTLNRMLDRIADLMESLRQVSAGIAHDLRTPLARLRQRLEDSQRHAGSVEERQAATETAIAQVDDILATFGALLRIAQIESGAKRSGFRRVDLSAVFTAVADAFSAVAEDSGRSLAVQVEPGITVDGDRELLTQMLANLVENAYRHTPEGTRMEISLGTMGMAVTGTVADNGPGVPDTERERIFRRFYRLDESRSTPGSGLGLSLVAAIADLHGIRIEVQDNRPGLRFILHFERSGDSPRSANINNGLQKTNLALIP